MIAIDVGNTRIKFGRFQIGHVGGRNDLPQCIDFLAVRWSDGSLPWDQLEQFVQRDTRYAENAPAFFASSVNSDGLTRLLSEWPEHWPKPRLFTNAELPILNRTRYPDKVGTDRLLKAVAANIIRPPGCPIVVVDSGTATTVDWISDQGEFLGGAILPGIELSARALRIHTDQLPLVDLQNLTSGPCAIGDETRAAIQSGLFWGQVGAIRELIWRMSEERSQPHPSILITGGAGELLTKYLENANYRATLTLEGLVIVQAHMCPET